MDKVKPVSSGIGKKLLPVMAISLVLIGISAYLYFQKQARLPNRPQEPEGPFQYHIEDVSFSNATANVTLSGTLTIPSNQSQKHPAVILISGSGPQNRDGEWIGHKPFLVIADQLTRQGVAVLRYDDRGFGKSTGDFHSGTSLDFSTDVESAIQFLKTRKEIDTKEIGLIGHSDGAMIAPMVAARSSDVSFIVMLAGPGILVSELMVKRQELLDRKAGKSEHEIQQSREYLEKLIKIIINSENESGLRRALEKFANETKDQIPDEQVPAGMTKDEFISRQIAMLTSPFFKYCFTYDPRPTLQQVKCPVLALNGDKDVQVPSEENLQAIKSGIASGGNNDVTIKELKDLNHMFQECTTGMIDEYAKIDQTFSPLALDEISQWILKRVKP